MKLLKNWLPKRCEGFFLIWLNLNTYLIIDIQQLRLLIIFSIQLFLNKKKEMCEDFIRKFINSFQNFRKYFFCAEKRKKHRMPFLYYNSHLGIIFVFSLFFFGYSYSRRFLFTGCIL